MNILISTNEASKRLGVSIWTLYKWAKLRKIASVRLGNKLLFTLEDINFFISQNRIPEITTNKNSKN